MNSTSPTLRDEMFDALLDMAWMTNEVLHLRSPVYKDIFVEESDAEPEIEVQAQQPDVMALNIIDFMQKNPTAVFDQYLETKRKEEDQ